MKKEERLHRLLGEIDDDLVADAARRPIPKAVWMPLVAAAACVALTVGLWQGGVFSPAPIPVETPDESTTTVEPTEPTKTTAKPTESTKTTEPSKTTAKHTDPSKTTAKPTEPSKTTKQPTKTEPTKTTVTTIDGKMVVFADEASIIPNSRPLGGYLHGTVKEKMEQYKGQDVLYAVIVEVLTLPEEYHELYPPDHAPQPKDEWENEEEWREYADKYFERYLDQRTEKLKEITNKELISISTDKRYFGFYTDEKYAFFMELTAEEINKLDKCDCFFIRLRHPDGDDAAGILIPG